MLQKTTVRFLKELRKNNNKPWMDANRTAYEDAKADFAGFVQQLIDKHAKKDPAIAHLAAKDCTFRINRDIRFAKDKSPYKSNFGASLNQGGKKGLTTAGYYFHCQPGESFAGGGFWMPDARILKNIRQEIDYNLKEMEKIVRTKQFVKCFGELSQDPEYKLSRVPKGYEADNPAAEFLKLKSYIATRTVPDELLSSKELLKHSLEAFDALQPLIYFINQSTEE